MTNISAIIQLREALKEERETSARLRALVEKRERQIVFIVRNCVGLVRNGFTIVNDNYTLEIDHDGTDAGLLAAVDEGTASPTARHSSSS